MEFGNGYSAFASNPVNYTDPYGLDAVTQTGGGNPEDVEDVVEERSWWDAVEPFITDGLTLYEEYQKYDEVIDHYKSFDDFKNSFTHEWSHEMLPILFPEPIIETEAEYYGAKAANYVVTAQSIVEMIAGAKIAVGGTAGGGVVAGGSGGTLTVVGVGIAAGAITLGTGMIVHGLNTLLYSWNRDITGSYTNTHESGKQYHGKGTEERAARSGKEKAKEYGDPLVETDWKPAKNATEAFKDEHKRLKAGGGPKSKKNYNKINSPGKKLSGE